MALNKLMNKSFLTRTLSGIALIAILLVTFILGGYCIFGLTLLLSLVGLSEVYKTVGIEKKCLGIIGYIGVIVYYGLLLWKGTAYMSVFIVALLMLVMIAFVFTFPKYKVEQVMMSFFGVVYVAILMSFLYLIRETTADGMITIWLAIISSWGCDTCAYLAGVTMGKHKMTPVLSPKKTIEGAIGGIIGAAAIGAIYGVAVGGYVEQIENAPLYFAIISACAGLVAMVGDLAASAIKRCYDIKDYGKLIPGHGGVLDRFDSVIFTAPVIYYLIYFLF